MAYQSFKYRRAYYSIVYGIIIISTAVAMVLLMLDCVGAFKECAIAQRTYDEKKDDLDELRKEIYLSYASNDIADLTGQDGMTDENLDAIKKHLALIDHQQQNSLDDVRQETNNIINKVNGWIGFWIAVLAIFGCIIPMVVQHILRQKSKQEIERLVDDITKKVTYNEIQMLVTNICINRELDILRDNRKRKVFIDFIVAQIYDNQCELIRLIDNKENYLDRETETLVLNSLIQYYRLLSELIYLSQRSKLRDLDNLRKEVRDIIKDIIDHQGASRHKIWARLLDLLPKLSHLPYELKPRP